MLELFARLELRLHPIRLLSTAGPCLGWIFWVLIFGKDLRVGTARPIGVNRVVRFFKHSQTRFKLGLLLRYLASQRQSHTFVQTPQLLCGHGFESIPFHEAASRAAIPPPKGAVQHDAKTTSAS